MAGQREEAISVYEHGIVATQADELLRYYNQYRKELGLGAATFDVVRASAPSRRYPAPSAAAKMTSTGADSQRAAVPACLQAGKFMTQGRDLELRMVNLGKELSAPEGKIWDVCRGLQAYGDITLKAMEAARVYANGLSECIAATGERAGEAEALGAARQASKWDTPASERRLINVAQQGVCRDVDCAINGLASACTR